jgi:thioredoxin reductase (NADPH)
MQPDTRNTKVAIVGAGLAGLSAAIYLARARRATQVIDSGQSLAAWEPDVQNYLGFPEGIHGEELLRRGREQAARYGVQITQDRVESARHGDGRFVLEGKSGVEYRSTHLLLATGLFHLPPEIPGVDACLGHSMFFCKDCDAHRVSGKRIAILGSNNEAVEYALGMLLYSPCVVLATNRQKPRWDELHAEWLQEYEVPIYEERITAVHHKEGHLFSIVFDDHRCVAVDSVFTTRGDIYHNSLAKSLGAEIDEEGQIVVNEDGLTSVPRLYAAGCVTPANCQMIVAAGQGATAAQAINRAIFEESLRNHTLRRYREQQLRTEQTEPEVLP